ncbi:MAG: hypothetical protein Tsb0013_10360 [Phycisphaerales bacterium]
MMVPSIDLMDGRAVQLVGGERLEIDAGDPRPIAQRFGRVGEIAVIDLDAALGRGSNAGVIEELLSIAPCRVGGGIRDVETAVRWLDRGARKVILGTAATPEVLRELPRDRVIAALDARDGDVVVEGWTKGTGRRVDERIDELKAYVGGFLVTFVELEGRMRGLPEERVRALAERCGDARLTVAGGVKTPADVGMADRCGADAQVGMALYSGAFDLAEGFCAPLVSDRADGLWPTVVCDEHDQALGLVYSNLESVRASLESGRGVYWSRSRGALWEKGATSGDTQDLLSIGADCDRDALRFRVRQRGGGFCHTGTRTCFGAGHGIAALERTLRERLASAPAGSYTRRLFDDPDLLRSKLLEEAGELIDARDAGEASWEAADVIYFALVRAVAQGATLESIEAQLHARSRKVTRRSGDAKEGARAE